MPTYPLPTLAATVSAAGITAPAYADIYQSLQTSFQAIYGSDAYIDPDSQDGQLLAVFAQAISDCNDTSIDVWNKFGPATAVGVGLSSQVKINGISRGIATQGSVVLRVVGVVGSIIVDGIASDALNNQWVLPTPLVIPPAGQIDVTALAQVTGAVAGPIGTINQIVNPQLGWQSVTNPASASPGAPIETDAALRQRQTVSTALPSQTVLSGTTGAIAQLPGVTQVVVYENDTDSTNANGQTPHSIAAVVLGGVASDIAAAILAHKTPGAFTFGSTVVVVSDQYGIPYNIAFSVPTAVPLAIAITIKAYAGYTTAIGNQILASLVAYINGLGIGARSDIGRLYLPAQFYGGVGSNTFDVNVLQQAIKPATPTAADITIAFNARATLALADITLTVT